MEHRRWHGNQQSIDGGKKELICDWTLINNFSKLAVSSAPAFTANPNSWPIVGIIMIIMNEEITTVCIWILPQGAILQCEHTIIGFELINQHEGVHWQLIII